MKRVDNFNTNNSKQLNNVLILGANQRSALAETRSMGKRGIPVRVADECRETLAGSSRYCEETFVYPSPYKCLQDFIITLRKECVKRHINIIFPMTEITTYLLLKHRNEFNDKLRKEYERKEPIFNLARIGAVSSRKEITIYEDGGEIFYALNHEYTNDGGHLNENGRKLAAEQLLIFLGGVSER